MSTGTQVIGSDGVIGVSGKPVRVFSVNVVSGGTGGVFVLRNGTSASGTVYLQLTGTANVGVLWDIHGGMFFPGGCFYDDDSNNTHVGITFEQERR